MASSIVEHARALHEDSERRRVDVVQDFVHNKPRTHKGDLLQQHRLATCIEAIHKNNTGLQAIYQDEDRALAEELERITPSNMFTLFYEELKVLRESQWHSRPMYMGGFYGDDDGAGELSKPEPELPVTFTGEEKFGKYVDMSHLHERFVNLPIFKGQKRLDYSEYLKTFSRNIPTCQGIHEYVDALLQYLKDFHFRIHPLFPIDKIVAEIEHEFNSSISPNDRLYCAACQKRFTKSSVLDAHLKSKKHLRRVEQGLTTPGYPFKLYQVEIFAELLSDVIANTVARVEVQQTRTFQEIQAERNDFSEEESESDDDSEEDTVLYNPKNVPLGWDGKPIPYWLYKLHGLNIEYRCEICGNYAYMGPRNFERHFTEWRHVNGMKSLKIPNSHHFKYVTDINDAIALYKKVKQIEKGREWIPENDEEMEDKQGNVFKKKTFDDLKRQGII